MNRYGIRVGLRARLQCGGSVVANVSRSVLEKAPSLYPEADVYTLYITATMPTLRARLSARQRENAEQVDARIKQALSKVPTGKNVVRIINEASLASAYKRTAAALTGVTEYSVWLLPAETDAAYTTAVALIKKLSSASAAATNVAGTLSAGAGATGLADPGAVLVHTFPPHINLVSGIVGFQRDAIETAKAIAVATRPVDIRFNGVEHSDHRFRAVTVAVEPTRALLEAREMAVRIFARKRHTLTAAGKTSEFRPHMPLLYGQHSEVQRMKAVEVVHSDGLAAAEPTGMHFTARKLAVVATTTPDYNCWPVVATFELAP